MSLTNNQINNLKLQKKCRSFQNNGKGQNGGLFKYIAGDTYIIKELALNRYK